MKTVAVLGGSGVSGRGIAEWLLADEGTDVRLLGRTETKLRAVADSIDDPRVTIKVVDTKDQISLRAALKGASLIVVAAPILDQCAAVAQTALDTGVNWLDILIDTGPKLKALTAIAPLFERAGLSLITGSGVHPGLPGVMARAIAGHYATLQKVEVGMLMSVDWSKYGFTDETANEFVVEGMSFKTAGLVRGAYRKYWWIDPRALRRVDFGAPFGKRGCVLMELEEIRGLKQLYPGLDTAYMAIAGFSPLVDWVIMPAGMAMMAVSKKAVPTATRMFWNGLRRSAKPPFGITVTMTASGDGNDPVKLVVRHEDAYWLTSAVAGATARQMLDGVITAKGLHSAALMADAHQLLADIEAAGAELILSTT